LDRAFPHLARPYRELYRGGSYLPKHYQHEVAGRVRQAAQRHGMNEGDRGDARQVPTSPSEASALGTPRRPPSSAEPEQLSLL
jgi:hypothetical protein